MLVQCICCSVLSLGLILCVAHITPADTVEHGILELEARLICESASQLMEAGEHEHTLRRLHHLRTEYPGSPYAALAQEKIEEARILRTRPGPISGLSRASLVGFGTLFSTWMAVGTIVIAEAEDVEAFGLALIAGPLAGIGVSRSLTDGIQLSDGQASLINLGGAWGIWQATGAAAVADVGGRAAVGASMAGGLAGLAISIKAVQNQYITPGDATMINFGGIWGTWLGLCGVAVADTQDEDATLASAMLAGDTGLLAMILLTPRWNMSQARARLINVGGIVGTLYGYGMSVLLDIDAKPNVWGTMGAGSLLGLTAGAYLTRDHDIGTGYFADLSRIPRDARRSSAIAGQSHGTSGWASANGDMQLPLLAVRF